MIKSEYQEHIEVASWLRVKGWRFHHSPNETYTTSIKQKMMNKRKGVSPGFPDLLVVTPRTGLVFIELKRTKGSKTSDEQESWLEVLQLWGHPCAVCKGAKEAIAFLGMFG